LHARGKVARTDAALLCAAMRPYGQALLEREGELSEITELLAARDGRLAVIAGEPGIGKTALITAAREIALRSGTEVLSARAGELEQSLPFGVVRQLIEPVLLGCTPDEREELFAGAAGLARPLLAPAPDARTVAQPDPDFGVLHGLYWLVASLARRGPLLLALDDLQWSDNSSLRFLRFLLRRVEGLPVAIVAALRSGTQGPAAELLDEPGARVIRPRGLSQAAVEHLLRERIGSAPAELARTCRHSTGGVPLYVLAALDALETDGAASEELEGLGADVVLRSVDRSLRALEPEALRLVEAIAVLGDGIDMALAAKLAELDPGVARKAARRLQDSAILAGGELLSFAHPVIRAALYARLPGDPQIAHTRAAHLLIESNASADEIALQLLRAKPEAEPLARELLGLAATSALARGAPDAAASFLTRLLEEQLSQDERVEALLALGVAEARAGLGGAVEHLQQARAAAGDPEHRATAALTLARMLFAMGRPRESVELLHRDAQALAEVTPERANELEAELRALADIDLAVRPYALSLDGAGRARQSAELEGDPVRCAHEAVALVMRGDSARLAAELAERALRDGGLERQAIAGGQLYFLTAFVLTVADRLDAAEQWITPGLEAAQAHGSGPGFALAAAQRAFARVCRGALAEAEADARSALELSGINGWPPLAQMALTPLIDVLIERGEPELANAAAAAAGVDLEALEPTTQGTVLLEARGRLRIALGEEQAGIADLLQAGERLEGWGVESAWPFAWRSSAALALANVGESERARQLVARELEMARRWNAPRTLGSTLCAAGQLETGARQLELFEAAVEALGDSPAELVRAHALTHLGAALRRAGRRSDSRAPLREGLELARACGASPLVHRAHTELWATGARPRTPLRTGLHALTASELRVARMAAAGQSNPAIAQALFVTIKTVEMHLTNVYRKLEIAGRAELLGALGADHPSGSRA
jgi:DNA-binding CsgD family transcriptional regulator